MLNLLRMTDGARRVLFTTMPPARGAAVANRLYSTPLGLSLISAAWLPYCKAERCLIGVLRVLPWRPALFRVGCLWWLYHACISFLALK